MPVELVHPFKRRAGEEGRRGTMIFPRSHPLSLSVVAWCAWLVFSLVGKTWRFAYEGSRLWNPIFSDVKGTVFCFWHSGILLFAYGYRHRGVITLVSQSRDGDLAAAIARRWGQETIRGSSSRGGEMAALGCIAALQNGRNIAIVPDGPRGPCQKAKPGFARIAILAQAPVVPVSTRVSRAWYLNTWDRFVIPKPGARITFIFHDGIYTSNMIHNEHNVLQLTGLVQRALSS